MSTPNLISHATVLVVDDAPENLTQLGNMLKGQYTVKIARNGETALRFATTEQAPDLILLDIIMPGMDGYEVFRQLKEIPKTRNVPVIFLGAGNPSEDEARSFELGAADLIAKPFNPTVVLARVKAQLQLKASADFLRDQNSFLEQTVHQRTHEALSVQEAAIMAMATLIESRGSSHGAVLRRKQQQILILARHLQKKPAYAPHLSNEVIELIRKAAPLQDIGTVGIPDRILLKPGRLTPEEFGTMKMHATIGFETILQAEKELGKHSEFLRYAKEITHSHQEKWDGSGYPQGLAGEAIPLSARMAAVVDVYDAITSKRIYKPALSHEEAIKIIAENRGKHFDPAIASAFLEIASEVRQVAQRFAEKLDVQAEIKRLETVVDEKIELS
ncbi:MAG: response regulator [Betaproteobacteria bacterium]|nr:response regulator [Betaproteobacteria bacterium]